MSSQSVQNRQSQMGAPSGTTIPPHILAGISSETQTDPYIPLENGDAVVPRKIGFSVGNLNFGLPKAPLASALPTSAANTALNIYNLAKADYAVMSSQQKAMFITENSASLLSSLSGTGEGGIKLAAKVSKTGNMFHTAGKVAKAMQGAQAFAYGIKAGLSIADAIMNIDNLKGVQKDIAIAKASLDGAAATIFMIGLGLTATGIGAPIGVILKIGAAIVSFVSSIIDAFDGSNEYKPNINGTDASGTLDGTNTYNRIMGYAGDDTINGRGGNDVIWGGAGNDTINGGSGDDTIYGGVAGEIVRFPDGSLSGVRGASSGDDDIFGGDGHDKIWGEDGNDTIIGGKGWEQLWGGEGNDTIAGGNGWDKIWGGEGNDTIIGGDGGDHLYGGDGGDRLRGGRGDDELDGGAGSDWLYGGEGRDTLTGGLGRDHFVLTDVVASISQADRVTDFGFSGEADTIELGSQVNKVWIKRQDVDGDGKTDTILYNNATGRMDASGNGVYAILNDYSVVLTEDHFVDGDGNTLNGFTIIEIQ